MKQASNARPLLVARWLWAVAVLVAGIVVVGGITRLTESGVSITEWKPVSGALPPLTQAAWEAEFAKYRATPQYILINGPAGMTLATYKAIFFWEWVHRLLARGIGMVFALPLAIFWIRRQIPAGYHGRLVALLALGGLQGAVGWWMVKSGIAHDVKVSHLRLATHLGVALFTLAGLVWTALDLQALARGQKRSRLTGLGALAGAVLGVQLIWGAFTAGLRAGHVTDEWPLMNGHIWPGPTQSGETFLQAITDDPAIVHFLHRWWAWVVVGVLVMLARALKQRGRREPSIAIHSAFGTQILLGIATVMSGVSIPLAVAHQLVGALLVVATVWGMHALGSERWS
ncbi:cytochrome c oxidase assembly protein subunit 15 [Novosphingobium sp. SG751A]|uniref:COX15/CtaA family protein n=1 Tax=Novosphingobium sp. SG751A TaxID=2587000 RepID=UPI00155330FB|nr:COX15/CtaA family protein [Novosphingobium sp. SG751A]NOW45567.1 cytochrome c oxidase assembly protein subunit 15 [Novosphingobium sp. SG751A]